MHYLNFFECVGLNLIQILSTELGSDVQMLGSEHVSSKFFCQKLFALVGFQKVSNFKVYKVSLIALFQATIFLILALPLNLIFRIKLNLNLSKKSKMFPLYTPRISMICVRPGFLKLFYFFERCPDAEALIDKVNPYARVQEKISTLSIFSVFCYS